jgi:DNA-binding MarR family transcriptional regulator
MADPESAAAEIGRLYPAVYRRFHVSRRHVAGSDLTPRMLAVVQHLASSGPLTVGELATHLGLSKAATTELVDRVEERGLIDRMRDDRDRRRVFLWLTETGRDQARQLSATHARVLEENVLLAAVRRMAPGDRDGLIRGLHALLAAADHAAAGNAAAGNAAAGDTAAAATTKHSGQTTNHSGQGAKR